MFDFIDTPPAWSFSWCYVYLFATVIAVALLVFGALTNIKKLNFMFLFAIALSIFLQFAHGMTYFWMCRSSLRPYANEGFVAPKKYK